MTPEAAPPTPAAPDGTEPQTADERRGVPVPPAAARRPHLLEAHGDRRVDEWYWLMSPDRDDPEVVAYLEAENAYAEAMTAPLADLREQLFNEIKDRIVETDVSAPSRSGPWWYWSRTEEGRQYGISCRRADPERRLSAAAVLADAQAGAESTEVVLDENELAADSDYFALGVFDISQDHRTLAFATDLDGSERYRLRFRDLEGGGDLSDVIENVQYGSAWAADNRTFFYVRPDEAMRPFQVWRHVLGEDPSADVLVFEEPDERFFVSVGLTRSERFVLIESASKITSLVLAIDAARPESDPVPVLPRRDGIEYDVDHAVLPGVGDAWLVRSNVAYPTSGGEQATNFAVHILPAGDAGGDPGAWNRLQVLLPHRPAVKVESATAFRSHLVIGEREEGLQRLRVLTLGTAGGPLVADDFAIDQPEPVYTLGMGSNPEFDSTSFRFGYTSLVAPPSAIDYDLVTRRREVVRTQPVRGGYRPEDFRTERIWATAADGTRVPISLVAPKDQVLDGSAPCLLYGYGSYEITIDPTFSAARVNLLRRGFTFAIAHIRGGGELGREWYEDGKLGRKRNTFSDFIAAAEHLIAAGWTSPSRLVARGASAGGLLMGAVTNLRPELWRAVVAEVPFVDVLTTMSDPDLPLTVTEWEEWGNPVEDAEAYFYMKSYSPYDNVPAAGAAGTGAAGGAGAASAGAGAPGGDGPGPHADGPGPHADGPGPHGDGPGPDGDGPGPDGDGPADPAGGAPAAGGSRPAMYVTAGLNDPRVGYWEPAKWVAKMRAVGWDDSPVVLRTEMGAGHQGPSGRYDAWRDEARVQAFVLSAVGLGPPLPTPRPAAPGTAGVTGSDDVAERQG